MSEVFPACSDAVHIYTDMQLQRTAAGFGACKGAGGSDKLDKLHYGAGDNSVRSDTGDRHQRISRPEILQAPAAAVCVPAAADAAGGSGKTGVADAATLR